MTQSPYFSLTPTPTSGVVAVTPPEPLAIDLPMPAAGERRCLLGWTTFLGAVYPEVASADEAASARLHARHSIAV
jgi:hypothetical protein